MHADIVKKVNVKLSKKNSISSSTNGNFKIAKTKKDYKLNVFHGEVDILTPQERINVKKGQSFKIDDFAIKQIKVPIIINKALKEKDQLKINWLAPKQKVQNYNILIYSEDPSKSPEIFSSKNENYTLPFKKAYRFVKIEAKTDKGTISSPRFPIAIKKRTYKLSTMEKIKANIPNRKDFNLEDELTQEIKNIMKRTEKRKKIK